MYCLYCSTWLTGVDGALEAIWARHRTSISYPKSSSTTTIQSSDKGSFISSPEEVSNPADASRKRINLVARSCQIRGAKTSYSLLGGQMDFCRKEMYWWNKD